MLRPKYEKPIVEFSIKRSYNLGTSFILQEKSSGRSAHYKLTSTVMLWLQTTREGSGTMNLGGSLTRQQETDKTLSESSPHLVNIGQIVEVR